MPRALTILLLCLITLQVHAQIPDGTLHRRISAVSNFEFAIHNNGLLWGDTPIPEGGYYQYFAHWPRGSFHMGASGGIAILAKKGERLLVSELGLISQNTDFNHGPFRDFVPGRIGDENAGYDSTFSGSGWKYVDSPDYIVYSSLDYDKLTGVDISGSNVNDWPIRSVNGLPAYVQQPLARSQYPPVFRSDEDMFCVFKDTETRADEIYTSPDGESVPIGVEVQLTVFTWGTSAIKDVVVFDYLILNKSNEVLDSCYFLFSPHIRIRGPGGNNLSYRREIGSILTGPASSLVFVRVTGPGENPSGWSLPFGPPTLGYSALEAPIGYAGARVGLAYADCLERITFWLDSNGNRRSFFDDNGNRISDSLLYSVLTNPGVAPPYPSCVSYPIGPALLSEPFPMGLDETARFTYAIIFSDSLPHLRLLDDLIKRMHANNYQRPSPPPAPQLTAKGLNRAVKLTWDTRAEQATDIIIPDSLGRPFVGYRLLRAVREEGPYTELARWHVDSTLVHEYVDRGEDIGGLKNNVRYHYQLLSFDEGAPRIKLEPMESRPEKGMNRVSVVPSTEPLEEWEDLNAVQIVPNPYLIRHEGQRGEPRVYFNFLPAECTIRIYTLALDHVRTLHHSGGSRVEWDLTTEGGQLVASQMLIAHIEAPNGKTVTKKFSVILGR